MKTQDFVALVQASGFLGEVRQKELTDNAEWMTPKEREFLKEKITDTGKKIQTNNQKMLTELEKIEKALKDFQKKELPKLVKAQEGQEREEEQGQAAGLLKKY